MFDCVLVIHLLEAKPLTLLRGLYACLRFSWHFIAKGHNTFQFGSVWKFEVNHSGGTVLKLVALAFWLSALGFFVCLLIATSLRYPPLLCLSHGCVTSVMQVYPQ